MKSLFYFFVFILISGCGYAQTVAYPQYDANGMPIKTSKAIRRSVSTSDHSAQHKGTLTIIGKGGMPKNVGTYENNGQEVTLYRRKNNILQATGKVVRKNNGIFELWYYDTSGMLKPTIIPFKPNDRKKQK